MAGDRRDDQLPRDRALLQLVLVVAALRKEAEPFEGDLGAAARAAEDPAARHVVGRPERQVEGLVLAGAEIVLIFVQCHGRAPPPPLPTIGYEPVDAEGVRPSRRFA